MFFKANCMILGSREFRIWPNVLLVNVVKAARMIFMPVKPVCIFESSEPRRFRNQHETLARTG